MVGEGRPVAILDVREPWEVEICALTGGVNVPLSELPARLAATPAGDPLVVVCHHGVRSAHAAAWLRAGGRANARNLAGGLDAWARRIDPSMATY